MTQPHQPPQQKADAHPALALAVALDLHITSILRAINLFQHFFPTLWVAAYNRISRGNQRALRLLRAIAEGTYRAPRTRAPGRPRRTPSPRAPYLSRRLNALGLLADWRFRSTAEPLRHLLANPDTIATLGTLPPQARRTLGRVLRTPARLVGAEIPAILTPAGPPRPPYRRPQPAAPAAQSARGATHETPAARSARGAAHESPRSGGKYPRFNALRYSPGRMPPLVKKTSA